MSGRLMDSEELCQVAEVDPNTEIARFVLEDLAEVLISAGWKRSDIINVLATVRPTKLGDAFCEASQWQDIFEIYADNIRSNWV